MNIRRITDSVWQLWRDALKSTSMLIVTACIVLFLVLTALHLCHLLSWQRALSILGLSYVGVVQRLWFFQFFTAPLLHADLTHLAFNMLTLWMLGPSVEAVLGRRHYLVFSIFCAWCAMIGFLLCAPAAGTIGLGYSGVIFGILVAQATFFPHRRIYVYAFFPLQMKHAVLLLGAMELYFLLSPSRNGIAHSVHLFGAVGALVYLQGTRWWSARRKVKIHAAKSWKPRVLVRAAAQRCLRRAKDKRASFSLAHRSHTSQSCVQCGARLPVGKGSLCTRCAAQQTRPPIRPFMRGNIMPAAEQSVCLTILNGPLTGSRFVLSRESLTIGRAASNHIVVPDDKKVSRLHAEIISDDRGRYVVIDKNSRNGVFVNGKRIERHVLQSRDRIRIGTIEMGFIEDLIGPR